MFLRYITNILVKNKGTITTRFYIGCIYKTEKAAWVVYPWLYCRCHKGEIDTGRGAGDGLPACGYTPADTESVPRVKLMWILPQKINAV